MSYKFILVFMLLHKTFVTIYDRLYPDLFLNVKFIYST